LYDVIIIGGGHNGLTCASYLARAGKRALVLEANPDVGGFTAGGAVPGAPGFRMNTYAFEFPFVKVQPSVVEELELHRHGLRFASPDPHNTYLSPEGTQWSMYHDLGRTCESIARLSRRDAAYYEQMMRSLMDLARVGMPYLADHPTRPAPRTLASLLGGVAKGRKGLLPGARILLQSPKEVLDGFEREEVRAYLAMNVATGSFRPLDELTNTSIFAYFAFLHIWPLMRPVGGAGAFAEAIAASLRASGGEVRTSAPVEQITVRGGRATGVVLQNGEELAAKEVVAAIDPTTLFTRLLDDSDVPPEIRDEVDGMRVLSSGCSHFKADLAVSTRPTFPKHSVTDAELAGISFAPTVDVVERVMDEIRAGRLADDFPFYIATPSVLDRTLVPAGSEGDSIAVWVGAVPYELSDGTRWEDIRQKFFDKVIDRIEEYSPGIRESIIGANIRSPRDFNNEWAYKGSSRSIDLIPSQMGPWRPSPSLAGYETPGIDGLWRSGHGTHPMSGTSGWPGRITARTMLGETGPRRRSRGRRRP
jgi:beta-carotene ketolase (CrtO type)